MPVAKVGIIGGGQLGQMMILEAKALGIEFVIVDPTPNCPAHSISDKHIVADYHDLEAIRSLAEMVDVVTYEFEHISVAALKALEAEGHAVYPSSFTLEKIQNKLIQKQWLVQHNIPVPPFLPVEDCREIAAAAEVLGYPLVLKTCTGGYDGKGNMVIQHQEEIPEAYARLGSGSLPLLAEAYIPYAKELSVLACTNTHGARRIFPIPENFHLNSILDETLVPASIDKDVEAQAVQIAEQAIEAFQSQGMLCIELFLTAEGRLIVNELAPRPHNSGHYTIEGCSTSQFQQHIRGILGLPLGSTALLRPTVMKNLIGTRAGVSEPEGIRQALQGEGVQLHLYGKAQVAIGRKMGHLTATGDSIEDALEAVRQAHQCIQL